MGQLAPAAAVGRAGATLADLLTHRAGLPAFAPLFVPMLRGMPALLEPGCPPGVRAAARVETVARALAVAPEARPGVRARLQRRGLHSCSGSFWRGWRGRPWTRCSSSASRGRSGWACASIACPPASRGRPAVGARAGPPGRLVIAPTGRTRPREPAPGQEGLWEPFAPHPSPAGEVDDDNAWVMDGVAGHAGLFGTAPELADLRSGDPGRLGWRRTARAVRPAGRAALQRDTATPGSTRALGFDTRGPGRSVGESSAGPGVWGWCRRAPSGHTGYTGTSLWVDLGRRLVVALCTNRTAGPRGRADVRINDFRPRFHDTVVELLGLA